MVTQRGFSLVELIVTLAITGVLLGIGLSSMQTMLTNNRVKSAAESVLVGLRQARSEAIARNSPMRFQLVSSVTAGCALSTTSQLWVVSQTDQTNYGRVAGLGMVGVCDSAPELPSDACGFDATPCADLPFIAYKSPSNSQPNVTVAANSSVITFGPLGQTMTTNYGGTAVLATVDFSAPDDPDAKSWRVQINSSSGAIKMCDVPGTGGSLPC